MTNFDLITKIMTIYFTYNQNFDRRKPKPYQI